MGKVVEKLEKHFAPFEVTLKGQRPAFLPISRNDARITFIDGGCATIFQSPSALVQLVRVAAVECEGSKRISSEITEAVCLITKEDGMHVEWSNGWQDLILTGTTLEQAAEIARRVAERSQAEGKGLVCFDGDLHSQHQYESQVTSRLERHFGIAKTSTKLTDQGRSVTGALIRAGPEGPWIVPLSGKNAVVKLHPKSRRAFVLESSGIGVAEAAAVVIGQNDAAFVGYPYGLVEADRLARVTTQEQMALKEILRTRLRGKGDSEAAALDAHDVLDSIAGSTPKKW